MKFKIAVSLIATSILMGKQHIQEQTLFDLFSVKNSYELAISGDVLYWQPQEEGLEFAITNSGSTTTITNGHGKGFDASWNWGGRVALDYKLPQHDQWDLNWCYTYFHVTQSKNASAPAGGALFPSFTIPQSSAVYATHAHARWIANLNKFDFELGRNCMITKWLSIRVHMDVSGLAIDQRMHMNYSGGTIGDSDHVKLRNNFWGVGLRFGFNSMWGLGRGFSIYADGAASLLSGHFHVRQKEHLEVADTTLQDVRNSPSNVVPIAEIALGLKWDYLFCKDRYHFGVKLGWEFNDYFDQNQLMQFVSSTNRGLFVQQNGDLTFMGLTLGFRFDF